MQHPYAEPLEYRHPFAGGAPGRKGSEPLSHCRGHPNLPPNWEQLDRELLETERIILEAGEVLDEPHVHRDFVCRWATLLDAAAILKAAGENVSGQEMKNFFGRRHRIQDDLKRWIQTVRT